LIFVCYRRDDSRRLAESLAEKLRDFCGRSSAVFRDDSIRGEDFEERIKQELEDREVFLVVIGKYWLGKLNERKDDESDWVRREIEAALRSGKHVIPILEVGTEMPAKAELPQSIRKLASQNEFKLTENLSDDIDRLANKFFPADVLARIHEEKQRQEEQKEREDQRRQTEAKKEKWKQLVLAVVAGAAMVVGVIIYLAMRSDPCDWPEQDFGSDVTLKLNYGGHPLSAESIEVDYDGSEGPESINKDEGRWKFRIPDTEIPCRFVTIRAREDGPEGRALIGFGELQNGKTIEANLMADIENKTELPGRVEGSKSGPRTRVRVQRGDEAVFACTEDDGKFRVAVPWPKTETSPTEETSLTNVSVVAERGCRSEEKNGTLELFEQQGRDGNLVIYMESDEGH
jgi:TIR domain-containing protein